MRKFLIFCLAICITGGLIFISCKKDRSCEGCADGSSEAPVAIAGNDTLIILPLDSVILDGSHSHDPDGSISDYRWSKIAGPAPFTILSPQSPATGVRGLAQGIYQFELKVIDNDNLVARDTVKITVGIATSNNQPPVADAGPDQTIVLPINNVLLDGSASNDPDNNITLYQWSAISGPPAYNIINAATTQTALTSLIEGVYQFELKVTDAGGLIDRDTVTITVNRNGPTNQPPVANAGTDKVVTLPSNSAVCDGSGSTDPDNNITSYKWTKITGPISFSLTSPDAPITLVSSLVEGVYQFELKVTDAGGLFSTDTCRVTVNPVPPPLLCAPNRPETNATRVPIGSLSRPRGGMAVASAGNKIVFAGGFCEPSSTERYGSSRVDIYDITTNSWTTAELSVARYGIVAVAAGNKIFFAGGTSGEIGDVTETYYRTVDIYDVVTNSWSIASLTENVAYVSAGTVGNKVFFAGGYGTTTIGNTTYYGYYSKKIDIYDLATNTWSTALLTESKVNMGVGTVNNKIYFAGGGGSNGFYSDRIDIYDNTTSSWSFSTLSEPKAGLATSVIGNKIYWAGGFNSQGESCKVEIRDVNTQSSSFQNLHRPAFVTAVTKNSAIVYERSWDNKFDIYDINSNTWSIGLKPVIRPECSIISVNNIIYVAGGYINNYTGMSPEVWKLEF